MKTFPIILQNTSSSCGIACIKMIGKFYNKKFSFLANCNSLGDQTGMTIKSLAKLSEINGFRTYGVKLPFQGSDEIIGLNNVDLPVIVLLDQHYVVVYKISKDLLHIADPAIGRVQLKRSEFIKKWETLSDKGIALLLEPTDKIYRKPIDRNFGWKDLFYKIRSLKGYSKMLIALLGILSINAAITYCFPFLTQTLIDTAIDKRIVGLISIIIIAYATCFIAIKIFESFQMILSTYLGAKVSISLLNELMTDIFRLPIAYFNKLTTGDVLQKINDQERIGIFLSSGAPTFIIYLVSFLIYSVYLAQVSLITVYILALGGIAYFLFAKAYFNKKKIADQNLYQLGGLNQTKIYELISGFEEIKLLGSQHKRKWQYINLQSKLFKARLNTIRVGLFQSHGASIILEITSLLILGILAYSIINKNTTIGQFFAVQFILGQLKGSLANGLNLYQSWQDAFISNERLNSFTSDYVSTHTKCNITNEYVGDILLKNVCFNYANTSKLALNDVSFIFSYGKINFIIGQSGSGKTTLARIISGILVPSSGEVLIGDKKLNYESIDDWYDSITYLSNESFIFPDTIAHNICEGREDINITRMIEASKAANIYDYIIGLPEKFNSVLGSSGTQFSQGQIQRILLARCFYRNSNYIILDEVTTGLDLRNERVIMQYLRKISSFKLIVIISHRKNSIINTDSGMFLRNGEVANEGESKLFVENDSFGLV